MVYCFDMLRELLKCSTPFPQEATLIYMKITLATSLCHPGSQCSGEFPVSATVDSVPLIEDHVHSLSQVVHGAVSRHRWVLLVTGPEGGEAKVHA